MGRTVFLTTLFQTIPSVTGLTQLVAFLCACCVATAALRLSR